MNDNYASADKMDSLQKTSSSHKVAHTSEFDAYDRMHSAHIKILTDLEQLVGTYNDFISKLALLRETGDENNNDNDDNNDNNDNNDNDVKRTMVGQKTAAQKNIEIEYFSDCVKTYHKTIADTKLITRVLLELKYCAR